MLKATKIPNSTTNVKNLTRSPEIGEESYNKAQINQTIQTGKKKRWTQSAHLGSISFVNVFWVRVSVAQLTW